MCFSGPPSEVAYLGCSLAFRTWQHLETCPQTGILFCEFLSENQRCLRAFGRRTRHSAHKNGAQLQALLPT